MNHITIVGLIASIATGTSLLPQLYKIFKDKEAGAISFGMLGVLFTGLAAWIYYGVLKNDLIIIIANSFSLLVNIATAILSYRYKKKEGDK